MSRLIRARTLVASTVASIIIAAPAAFALGTEGAEGGEPTDGNTELEIGEAGPFAYAFDPTTGTLILDLFADDRSDGGAGIGDECIPTEAPTGDGDSSEVTSTEPPDGIELPQGCLEVDVTGPNGQVNHGSVVSNVVHAMRALRTQLDGPLGQYVREIARSDLGKSGYEDGAVADSETRDGENDHPGKPDRANQGNPENAGPPEHSNAGGNSRGASQ